MRRCGRARPPRSSSCSASASRSSPPRQRGRPPSGVASTSRSAAMTTVRACVTGGIRIQNHQNSEWSKCSPLRMLQLKTVQLSCPAVHAHPGSTRCALLVLQQHCAGRLGQCAMLLLVPCADVKPAMNGLHAQHDDSLLWRVNQQEFSQRLRDRACVAYIRQRHDHVAAAVASALLHRPQGAERAPCQVCLLLCVFALPPVGRRVDIADVTEMQRCSADAAQHRLLEH